MSPKNKSSLVFSQDFVAFIVISAVSIVGVFSLMALLLFFNSEYWTYNFFSLVLFSFVADTFPWSAVLTGLYLSFTHDKNWALVTKFLFFVLLTHLIFFLMQSFFYGKLYFDWLAFSLYYMPLMVVPFGFLGYALGRFIQLLRKKTVPRFSAIRQIFLITFLLSLVMAFISGMFVSSPVIEDYTNYHYYLNRGSPFIFSGISSIDTPVQFPIIKVPWTVITLFGSSVEYIKIIHLWFFIRTILLYFLILIVPTVILVQNKLSRRSWIVGGIGYFVFLIYVYFLWSGRV